MTRREIENRLSGARTQLKRASGERRRRQLELYIGHLLDQREDHALEARLAELEGRWNALVDRATAYKICKADTAWRNSQAKRRARRGLGPLETASSELRRHAERQLLNSIDRHAGEPAADRAIAELDEADEIRTELLYRAETRAGIAA